MGGDEISYLSGSAMPRYLGKTVVSERTHDYLSEVLRQNYDLGSLSRAYLNHRGFVNINYEIETLREDSLQRYYMRFYRWGVLVEKVRFEHELLNELFRRGFHYSPKILRTLDGDTCARLIDPPIDGSRNFFATLFSFVGGDNKYIWKKPDCTQAELKDAARVLALYHNIISRWRGKESKRKRAFDRIPGMTKRWKHFVNSAEDSPFDTYLKETVGDIFFAIDQLSHLAVKWEYDALPHLAIHGDYHPGNLKFKEQKVAGVIDFDWSCMDARCFDVGMAIYYFCTLWRRGSDGFMCLDKVNRFLEAYQKEAARLDGVGPLNTMELKNLADLVCLAGLMISEWIANDYTSHRSDPMEYLSYLKHSVRHLRWMRDNKHELVKCIKPYQMVS